MILVTAMMRGVGDTVTPLLALVVYTLIGLVVDAGHDRAAGFGLPRLGVASAAWASVASSLLTLVVAVLSSAPAASCAGLRQRLSARDVAGRRNCCGRCCASAFRPRSSMMVMSAAELVLLGLVNGFGSDATAAYGAVDQVMSYVQFPALSIAMTVSIFGAQAIGRGHAGQVGAIVGTGLRMNLLLTGGTCSARLSLLAHLMGLFITDARGARAGAGAAAHRAVEHRAVRHGDGIFRRDALRAARSGRRSLISSFAIVAVEVPSAIILSRPHRHRRRLGGLSYRLLHHVRCCR